MNWQPGARLRAGARVVNVAGGGDESRAGRAADKSVAGHGTTTVD